MVKNVIAMACAAKQNTQATAFNSVARAAITQDPNWLGGYYGELEGTGPRSGLAVARYLIDAGYTDIFQLQGRSAESLLEEIRKSANLLPEPSTLPALRLAIYFSENQSNPDRTLLNLHAWQ